MVHTAVDNSLDLNPDNIIPKMQAATLGIAKAAAKTPTCRRFVYTSSSSAVAEPAPGVIRELTADSYNEETVRAAYSSDLRQDLVGGHTVYAAGKVKTEQALWDWYRGEAPKLVINTGQWTANSVPVRPSAMPDQVVSVIPSPCYGGILDPNHQKFSAANGMLKILWEGNDSEEIVKMFEARKSAPHQRKACDPVVTCIQNGSAMSKMFRHSMWVPCFYQALHLRDSLLMGGNTR